MCTNVMDGTLLRCVLM